MAKRPHESSAEEATTSAPGVGIRRYRSPREVSGATQCRRKFLSYFPGGFSDPGYLDWERNYKWEAHRRWQEVLNPERFRELLDQEDYSTVASLAVGIEGRTHLLFAFEKMALRDALRSAQACRTFAIELYNFLQGPAEVPDNFDRWCRVVEALPRKQSRVFTWPVVTVFGFLARPDKHFFFKPKVTRAAASRYGFELPYEPRPRWNTYSHILSFARLVRRDLKDLRPRDMIDVQSFLWVQGSCEYPESA
jgi:hypothetical protein